MSAAARVCALLAVLAAGGCGARLMDLPAGPGAPADDGAAVLAEATEACRAVSSLTADLGVSGRVGGRRLRARLQVGLAAPASARLEALAPFGQPLFIFVTRGADATLYLTRENRIVTDPSPAAVLEAVAGVPLDPEALRLTLVGCALAPRVEAARRVGDDWRIIPARGGDLYLQRSDQGWRLVAATYAGTGQAGWRAEYSDFRSGLPGRVRLVSRDRQRFDLRLAVSDAELNVPLREEVFTTGTIKILPSAVPMSVDELRRSGPLADVEPESADAR